MPSSKDPPNKPTKGPSELIARGQYGTSPLGSLTFIGLRALEPVLQYQLIRPDNGWLVSLFSKLSIKTIPAAFSAGSPLPTLSLLGLTLPLPHWIILSISSTAAIKQIFWHLYISREKLNPGVAALVIALEGTANTINSALFVASATSAVYALPTVTLPVLDQPVSLPLLAGALTFVAGITVETATEVQRKWFKDDPKNQGKICDVGLWGFARHINYGSYVIERFGYSLAAGGWVAAAVLGLSQAWQFANQAVGELDGYMTGKYGQKWVDHKKRVKYILVPGVY